MKTRKMTIAVSVLVFLLVPFFSGSVFAETTGAMDLVSMLTSQLGVTEPQAKGGAGSLFDMAKGMLPESDWTQVASAIPGVKELIGAAPAVSESTSKKSDKLAGLAGGLGAVTQAVESANKFAAVTDQFKQLGLNSEMVSQFVPVILSFTESAGGEQVMNILKSVWQ